MGDVFVPIVKNSVVGITLGAATGMAIDMVYGQIANLIPSNGHSSSASAYGGMIFSMVAAPAVAGMGVYLGDQLLGMIVDRGSDPLFGLMYLNTVYNQSKTIGGAANHVRAMLSGMMSGSQRQPPPKGGSGKGGSGGKAPPVGYMGAGPVMNAFETNLQTGGGSCCK
jgi:hypothetical protein